MFKFHVLYLDEKEMTIECDQFSASNNLFWFANFTEGSADAWLDMIRKWEKDPNHTYPAPRIHNNDIYIPFDVVRKVTRLN